MKRKIFGIGISIILIWVISLTFVAEPARASTVWWAEQAIRRAAQETGTNASIISITRKYLVDNIYEYKFILKVGLGEFDKIGVDWVVREILPWFPLPALKAVMMNHGDAATFDNSFLVSTISNKVPIDQSLGMYLAKNSIDVWGVDRRHTFVPQYDQEGNQYCYANGCTFMKYWDTAMHLRDIKLGVKFAREVRLLTGGGYNQILMLGHSRGAEYAYAYANEETHLSWWQRDLKGIIPVEMVYKFDPVNAAPQIQAACERYQAYKALSDSGIYYDDGAFNLKLIAFLAAKYPDILSPIPGFEGFTNEQVALIALIVTYATFDPLKPPVPFYHYLAGTFDQQYPFLPTGLRYANFGYILDIALSTATPSFQSLKETIDGEALWCNQIDLPFDDHLRQITIPVFYVGAAGGFGSYGQYTLKLLGSTDKKNLIIKLFPTQYEYLDYGHTDLLWANNAKSLVWKPISDWIKSH